MRMLKTRLAFAVLLPAVVLSGCASTGGRTPAAPDPVEAVLAALSDYHAALTAEDVGRLVATFSDEFQSPDGGSKAMMEGYFQGLIGMGALDGIEADMEECEIEVEGNEATVGPVWYETMMGRVGNRYTMKKEADGVWRIVSSEQI